MHILELMTVVYVLGSGLVGGGVIESKKKHSPGPL